MNTEEMTANMPTVEIKQIIAEMLKEDTGIAMMDSGGDTGRMWQRNQVVDDFDKTLALTVESEDDYLLITLSVYHFLIDILEVNHQTLGLNAEFKSYGESNEDPWYSNMVEWAEQKKKEHGEVWDSISVNTYNGDCNLTQTLQFIMFPQQGLVLLQIHGGADVRGGYTKPQFFKMEDEYAMLNYSDMGCSCDECGMEWTTDDHGYHWYDATRGNQNLSWDHNKDDTLDIRHTDCGGRLKFTFMGNST